MKYFTETISITLAEKLKEKGIELRTMDNERACFEKHLTIIQRRESIYKKEYFYELPTYAEVFDWLLEKEFVITIRADYYLNGEIAGWIPHFNHWGMKRCNSWHEAANKAIEKALTLI